MIAIDCPSDGDAPLAFMAGDVHDFELSEGLQGGVIDGPFVGAHMIDATTGRRCQVLEILDDDGTVLRVRFEDGEDDVIKVRRPTPDELRSVRRREADA
jgi:hypothetical protein